MQNKNGFPPKVPISILKLRTININVDDKMGQPSVLYDDSTCMVMALKGVVHAVFATRGFDPNSLALFIREEVFKSPVVSLSLYDSFDDDIKIEYVELPGWISNMTFLRNMTIQGGIKGSLKLLKHIPLTTLVTYDVLAKDKTDIINEIVAMQHLEYFVCNTLGEEEINYIKKRRPKLSVMTFDQYKAEKGNDKMNWP